MIFGGLSVIGFVVVLCFVAGYLVAMRAAKTPAGVTLLTVLFGVVFLLALSGIAVAGCVALFSLQ
jgi:heme A synthase